MADLIQLADLEDYGLTTEQTQAPIVATLISAASAEVIDAAESPILSTRSVIIRIQPPARRILALPGLPVSEVHSVLLDGEPITDWLQVAGGLYRHTGWGSAMPVPVTVDYTHGLQTVPADIKDLVARMVISGALTAEEGPEGLALNNGGLSSIAIDDFRESYATGADVEAVTEMTLPQRTRDRLAKRFGAGGPKSRGTW